MHAGDSLRNSLFRGTLRIVIASERKADKINPFECADVGAAFLVAKAQRIYVVTAAHVIRNAEDASIFFFRRRTTVDEPALFEFRRPSYFGELWHYSVDERLDIAITPLSPESEIVQALNAAGVTVEAFPLHDPRDLTPSALTVSYDLEEVLFAGYPAGYWDPVSGSPIVRRGITATPLSVDYQDDPVFLLDGAVYRGCSGGPVVVIERELVIPSPYIQEWARYEPLLHQERFLFLGMITDVQHEQGHPSNLLNLGRVVKAAQIFRVVEEYERLVSQNGSA
jgi:hypothetical protein